MKKLIEWRRGKVAATVPEAKNLDKELNYVPADTSEAERARDRSRTYALLADSVGLGATIAGVLDVDYLLDPPTDVKKKPAATASFKAQVLPELSGVAYPAEF